MAYHMKFLLGIEGKKLIQSAQIRAWCGLWI